jgi:flavin-dependent dehydrogenase
VIDVAIVGGGPAGSAAAIVCARAGHSSVLFERRVAADECAQGDDEPEESIGPDTVDLLQKLGIHCDATNTAYAGIATGSQVTFFLATSGRTGRHMRRSWLDCQLRRKASEAGAVCRQGVEVGTVEPRARDGFLLETSFGLVAARQLIDASGRRLWLARRWRLRQRKMSPPLIAWREVAPATAPRGPVAHFIPTTDGWTFSAQVGPDRIVRTHLRAAHAKNEAARNRTLFQAATAHVATWHVVRELAGRGWFITGEAAAALDPAAGIGIDFALRSGLAAGYAAVACAADHAVAPLVAARYDDALLSDFEAHAKELTSRYSELGIGILEKRPGRIALARE